MMVLNHGASLLFSIVVRAWQSLAEVFGVRLGEPERGHSKEAHEGLYVRMSLTMPCEAHSISIPLLPGSAYLDTRMRDSEIGATYILGIFTAVG